MLIVGASRGVGSYAVQIAKSFASLVSAVCSAKKADFVRSLDSDEIIDYSQQDFTKTGKLYNPFFVIGGSRSIIDYRCALKPNGIYIFAGRSVRQDFSATILRPLHIIRVSQEKDSFLAKPNQGDYDQLIKLSEAGKLTPAIDKHYPRSEVPDALRYYRDGKVKGKIVITLDHDKKLSCRLRALRWQRNARSL